MTTTALLKLADPREYRAPSPRWAVDDAVENSDLPAPARAVLHCLLRRCPRDSLDLGRFSLTEQEIARRTGLGLRTVKRQIARLRAEGWISASPRGRRHWYSLAIGAAPASVSAIVAIGAAPATPVSKIAIGAALAPVSEDGGQSGTMTGATDAPAIDSPLLTDQEKTDPRDEKPDSASPDSPSRAKEQGGRASFAEIARFCCWQGGHVTFREMSEEISASPDEARLDQSQDLPPAPAAPPAIEDAAPLDSTAALEAMAAGPARPGRFEELFEEAATDTEIPVKDVTIEISGETKGEPPTGPGLDELSSSEFAEFAAALEVEEL